MNGVKFSVLMPLYNMSRFLPQALDSVLKQKVNFAYKIKILDDGSTDNGLEIAREYQAKYPHVIEITENGRNLKLLRTIFKAYENLDTEYFCVLDPDDYWTDENKLQKAVDFLDADKRYVLYVTNLTCQGGRESLYILNAPTGGYSFSFEDYKAGRAILAQTTGTVFRNVVFKNGIPARLREMFELYDCEMFRADSFRNIAHLKEGLGYFDNISTAVYRVHEGGQWTSASETRQKLLNLRLYFLLYIYFGRTDYDFFIEKMVLNGLREIIRRGVPNGDAEDFFSLTEVLYKEFPAAKPLIQGYITEVSAMKGRREKSVPHQELEVLENFLKETPEHGIEKSANYIFERVKLNVQKIENTPDEILAQRFIWVFEKVKRYVDFVPNTYQSRIKPIRKMLRFEVHLCDHCNLNCKSCGHFSPIAEKRFVELDVLERDFKRLSELTDRKCETIDLMGGEPLLHPKVIEIFDIAKKYFDSKIQLVTNGILLANQPEEFWESCKKNALIIAISIYPIQINIEKIRAQAHKFGVVLAPREKFKENSWFKCKPDFTGSQDIEDAYLNCAYGGSCLYLEDGRLSHCALPALSKHFNRYFDKSDYKYAVPSEKDFIDIFKVNSLNEILEKFTRPIPYCRYCRVDGMDFIKWQSSKRQIEEWI